MFRGVDVEVSVRDGIATFKGGIVRISSFTIGDPGEPYCMIPGERLKLLNKFLGATMNNSTIMFKCEEGDQGDQTENFLFSIDRSTIIPIFD